MSADESEYKVGDCVGVKNNHGLPEYHVHRIVEVRRADRGRYKGQYAYILCCHNINGHCGAVLWRARELVKRSGPATCDWSPPPHDLVAACWQLFLYTDEQYHGARWNEPVAKRTRTKAPQWYEEDEVAGQDDDVVDVLRAALYDRGLKNY